MQAVEDCERGERPDDVFRLLQRAAGPQLIRGSQPLGEAAILERGRVGRGDDGREGAEEGGIGRPDRTGRGDAVAQLLAGIHGSVRGGRPGAGVRLTHDRAQQLGAGAESVVDREPRDARPPGHRAHVESRAAAGRDQLAGGRQDRGPGAVDSRLALAKIVPAVHARTLTYSLSTEQPGPIVRSDAPTTYHPVPMRLPDPLALRELSSLLRDPVFRGRGVPHGDGRPVLLVPGFLSGDWALTVLRNWLERIGYHAYMSGIYFNVRASEHMVAGLRHRLAEIHATDPARVTLVGHSRGGLLAKVLAQRRPDAIEQVIALGSPLA